MKVCKECGAQATDDQAFCANCGSSLADVEATKEIVTEAVAETAEEVKETVSETAKEVLQQESQTIPPAQQVQLEVAPNPEQQKKLKYLIMAGVGVVALLVLVLVINALVSTSYKDPLNKTVKAINSQTQDPQVLMNAALPKFVVTAYKDYLKYLQSYDKETDESKYDDLVDSMETMLLAFYDNLEDEYGKNVKVSYKIDKDSKEQLSSSELKTLTKQYKELESIVEWSESRVEAVKETLVNKYDMKKKDANKICDQLTEIFKDMGKEFKNVKITDGYKLKLEVTYKGKDDEDTENMTVVVIKLNGKWCVDISDLEIKSILRSLLSM